MSLREKITPSPTTIEPKKSVRLAQKRKLREESGPYNSSEDDYYFTPYQISKSNSPSRLKSQSSSSSPTIPSPSAKEKRTTTTKGKSATASPSDSFLSSAASNNTVASKVYAPSSKVYAPSSKSTSLPTFTSRLSMPSTEDSSPSSTVSAAAGRKKINQKGNNSNQEEVLEEEKWLDAIEAGNLEELDEELKQMKNPKLMTARQRAMLEKKDRDIYGFTIDDEITGLSLFGKEKEKLVITQEMVKLKAEKTEKRRQLAHEKKEKDKKKTMDRLLKKQDSKAVKAAIKPKNSKRPTDYKITFISKPDINIIAFPVNYPVPFEKTEKPQCPPPGITLCGVEGCQNPKKYSCSKTGVPLCSLTCYKKNILNQSMACG